MSCSGSGVLLGTSIRVLKIGIYKWPWAHLQKRVDVKQRVLYYDNLMYLR